MKNKVYTNKLILLTAESILFINKQDENMTIIICSSHCHKGLNSAQIMIKFDKQWPNFRTQPS